MSSVSTVDYNPEQKVLRVTLGGQTFIHRDVPSSVHAALIAAANQAQFYVSQIRDVYPRV
ncbi:MAG: hypothetical protein RL291_443 [Pseudomonadota bacterium]|jgi:hypothetical protein